MRDHLADRGHSGRRLFGACVHALHVFGFLELALQRQNKRQVLTDPRIGARALRGLAERRLGLRQLLGERVGQAEIGQNAGLARRYLQRRDVKLLGGVVVAHLVGDRALRGENGPIGTFRRMRAL